MCVCEMCVQVCVTVIVCVTVNMCMCVPVSVCVREAGRWPLRTLDIHDSVIGAARDGSRGRERRLTIPLAAVLNADQR